MPRSAPGPLQASPSTSAMTDPATADPAASPGPGRTSPHPGTAGSGVPAPLRIRAGLRADHELFQRGRLPPPARRPAHRAAAPATSQSGVLAAAWQEPWRHSRPGPGPRTYAATLLAGPALSLSGQHRDRLAGRTVAPRVAGRSGIAWHGWIARGARSSAGPSGHGIRGRCDDGRGAARASRAPSWLPVHESTQRTAAGCGMALPATAPSRLPPHHRGCVLRRFPGTLDG